MVKKKPARKKRCLTKDCPCDAAFRGLCSGCYQAALRAIRNGADEDALIKAKLILPARVSRVSAWTEQAEKAGVL